MNFLYSDCMNKNIKSLLNPSGIAVVGVSSNSKKLGSVILNNLVKNGYKGNLAGVNPKYTKLFDIDIYSKVTFIPFDVELAIIVIPAEYVFDSVKDCVRKGVKNAIIITAGFKEVGEEGKKLEEKIVKYANDNNMRIIGPNCLGVISTKANMNASFAAQHPKFGNIGFLSQSGAFNTAMLDLVSSNDLGFNYFISLGNKSDINEIDLFEDWFKDDSVNVIGAYLEEFEDGKKLVELASKNRHKPVILLNSGTSEAGKKAAASHTGSLAGSSRAIKTALKQAGIIHVDSVENMYSNLMMFAWCPRPKGDRIALITNAGGPAIIVTDILSSSGLELAELSEETKAQLKGSLPTTASVNNPVDIIGDALADRYQIALDIISKDQNVDIIIVLLTPQLVTQIEETAKIIIDFYQSHNFPLIPIFIGEKYVEPGLKRMWENNIPAYQYDEEAVRALKNLIHYSTKTRNKKHVSRPKLNGGKYTNKLNILIKNGLNAVPADIAKAIAEEENIDIPTELVSDDYKKISNFFMTNNFPVVLKATNEDISHKTEEKMIYLNINTKEELLHTYERLIETIKKYSNNPSPNVIIQEQIKAKEELILGINLDNTFGHIILFGKGGIYTEVYGDVSTRLVYADQDELRKMIDETRVSQILDGARGLEKLPTDKVISILEKLQRIVIKYPQIKSIDINPAMITVSRCIAVDIKMFV